MKKSIILLALVLVAFINKVSSQTVNVIQDSQVDFDSKPRQCLMVYVEPEARKMRKVWTKYMKKTYNVKFRDESGWFSGKELLTAKKITVAKVSQLPMDMYCKVSESSGGSQILLYANFGYENYINRKNHPESFDAMSSLLDLFLKDKLNKFYTNNLKDLNSTIKDLNNKKKKLSKNIAKNNKEINKSNMLLSELAAKPKTTSEAIRDGEILRTEKEALIKKLQDQTASDLLNIQVIEETLIVKKNKAKILSENHNRLLK